MAKYEKKLPMDLDCGIKIAMDVIGGKWKSCLIYDLRNGPLRPSLLLKNYPEANTRVINQQLRELCEYGVVEKTNFEKWILHHYKSVLSLDDERRVSHYVVRIVHMQAKPIELIRLKF